MWKRAGRAVPSRTVGNVRNCLVW